MDSQLLVYTLLISLDIDAFYWSVIFVKTKVNELKHKIHRKQIRN